MQLSIITICYNNLVGLKATMESVLSQTFKDYEWIVIDGGSTDGSKEFLESNNNAISYWVSEPDRGVYHAMNKGVAVAQGDYCQFLNSGDTLISPDILEKVFSYDLSDVTYGDVWIVKEGKVLEKRTYPDSLTFPYIFKYPINHQVAFIRTSLVKQHPYREQYSICADRFLFLKLFLTGSHFKHLPLPIVFFDDNGMSSRPENFPERDRQCHAIKQEFFYSSQVVDEIEQLIIDSENYHFVQRIAPLRWTYTFFKKLQILYGHFVSLILVGKW